MKLASSTQVPSRLFIHSWQDMTRTASCVGIAYRHSLLVGQEDALHRPAVCHLQEDFCGSMGGLASENDLRLRMLARARQTGEGRGSPAAALAEDEGLNIPE